VWEEPSTCQRTTCLAQGDWPDSPVSASPATRGCTDPAGPQVGTEYRLCSNVVADGGWSAPDEGECKFMCVDDTTGEWSNTAPGATDTESVTCAAKYGDAGLTGSRTRVCGTDANGDGVWEEPSTCQRVTCLADGGFGETDVVNSPASRQCPDVDGKPRTGDETRACSDVLADGGWSAPDDSQCKFKCLTNDGWTESAASATAYERPCYGTHPYGLGPARRTCDPAGSGIWSGVDFSSCSAASVCGDGKTVASAGEECDVADAGCDQTTCKAKDGYACGIGEDDTAATCALLGDGGKVAVPFSDATTGSVVAVARPSGLGRVRVELPARVLGSGNAAELGAVPSGETRPAPPAAFAQAYDSQFRVTASGGAGEPDYTEPMSFEVELDSPCDPTSRLHLFDEGAGAWRDAALTCSAAQRSSVLDPDTCVLTTNVCHLTDFTVLSCTGEQPTELVEAVSEITAGTGELRIGVRTDATRYTGPAALTFVGARTPTACNTVTGVAANGDAADDGAWLHEREGACVDLHTFYKDAATALDDCGFNGPTADAARGTYYYEATIEATTVEATSEVFGQTTTRTDRTAFTVRVEYPQDAAVDASAGAYGAVIDSAEVTTQVVSTATRVFTWTLATSVQYPYYLEATTTTSSDAGAFQGAAAAEKLPSTGGTCSSETSGACLQRFEIAAETGASECSVATTIRQNFAVRCRASFTGSCDAPDPATTFAEFDFSTGNLCAEVVEVASVSPTLALYATAGAREAQSPALIDFVEQQTVHGRVQIDVEGGVLVTSVALDDLTITSQCDGCDFPEAVAVAGGAIVNNADDATLGYSFAHRAVANQPRHDFEFVLNANSVSYDGDQTSGQTVIQIEAVVTVQYTDADGQASQESRRVRLAAAGGASTTVAATAQFGASSSSPSSSAPSASAASGSAAGVAMVAGAAVVGLIVVAAGAALVGRRRRRRHQQQAQKQLPTSSSSVELSHETGAPQAVGLEVQDLATVQDAYDIAFVVEGAE
jgi:hypothetical protein